MGLCCSQAHSRTALAVQIHNLQRCFCPCYPSHQPQLLKRAMPRRADSSCCDSGRAVADANLQDVSSGWVFRVVGCANAYSCCSGCQPAHIGIKKESLVSVLGVVHSSLSVSWDKLNICDDCFDAPDSFSGTVFAHQLSVAERLKLQNVVLTQAFVFLSWISCVSPYDTSNI